MHTTYTFGTRVRGTPEEVRPRVEAALRTEGFGVITEIDVKGVLKAKLGLDREPYLILGACNPRLAHRALDEDPSVGALLPCNVVLRAEGDHTVVEAVDPVAAMGVAASGRLAAIATEARAHLVRAIHALRESPADAGAVVV